MLTVRAADSGDCCALAELDAAGNSSPWTAQQFADSLRHGANRVLVAEQTAGELAGFIVWQTVCDEAELHLLATAPAWRRRGVASLLLAQLFAQAGQQGVRRILLEVRHSNQAAQALYRRHGFFECGQRPHYYPLPDGSREAAILMEKLC